MNLLFYVDRYPGIGGIENVTSIVTKELCKKHNIYLVSNIQQKDVTCPSYIHLLRMPNSLDEKSSYNLKYLVYCIQYYHIEALIYQDSYGNTDTNICKAVDRTGVKLFVFEHNSPLFVHNKKNLDSIFTLKGFLRRVMHPYLLYKDVARKKRLLNHSTKYVLLSKQFIPEFCKLIGVKIDDPRITFINNPAVAVDYRSGNQKENIILCVSRLEKEKCVDIMLEMWNDLSSRLLDWRFVIVGDGSERAKLEQYVLNRNIQRVDFIGFAKPTEFFRKSKIFWMTSKYEGWGLTLIEAMQHGCVPVAFLTFSSIVDIIEQNKTGFLVSANDKDTFMERTLSLAKDDCKRTMFSNNALEKVKQFSVDNIMVEWSRLLNS